jgi:peroxiredoxin
MLSIMRLTIVAFLVLICLAFNVTAVAPQSKSIRLEKIDLVDYRGRTWELDDFKDDKILVVAFLGTECPLAKHYSIRLQELADHYSDQKVCIVAVMSNRQDSLEEIAAFADRQKLEYPILKDLGNRLADQLSADRTPEIYVFDANRDLRYRGRIDDQYGIGYIRDDVRRHDLKIALEELLAGKQVSVPRTRAVGCIIGRQKKVDGTSEITYSSHIAPILNRHCVECHREGEIAPFSLTNYEDVAGWADMMAEVVRDGRMPPWHVTDEHSEFKNDRSLSDEERDALFAWSEAGAPAGNLSKLPKLPEKVTGWQLPKEPDLVIPIQQQPFNVPATGVVRYQYFYVDPKFEEDVWIKASEIKPGNPAVVHHVLGFAVDKGTKRVLLQAALGFKFAFVPGLRNEQPPAGHAMKIPAGKALLFQVHYTPIGTPQTDQSELGIIFAEPDEVTHEVIISSALQLDLAIPPRDPNYVVHAASPEFPPDATLLAVDPHMHVRGKAFRYDLELPDGTVRTIADMPNYDFNWQTTYVFKEPLLIPEGSRLLCEAAFDNSENNLNNPDPDDLVRFGEQTWDEMMIGYYVFAVPRGRTESGFTRTQIHEKNRLKSNLLQLYEFMDRDGDGKVTKNQMPGPAKMLFDAYNKDKDQFLTREEIRGDMPALVELLLATIFKTIR